MNFRIVPLEYCICYFSIFHGRKAAIPGQRTGLENDWEQDENLAKAERV